MIDNGLDFDDDADLEPVRQRVRQAVGGYDRSEFQRAVAARQFPSSLWRNLADAGLLGLHIPQVHGGGGAGFRESLTVLEELSRLGCPLRYFIIASTVSATLLSREGSPKVRETILRPLLEGRSGVCFALTEPGAGTNTRNLSASARPVEPSGGWLIRGTKSWVTGFELAQHVIVVAGTGESGTGRLSLFLVPTDAPGIMATPVESALGSPEGEFTLQFNDVLVPAHAMIGQEGAAFEALFAALNPERLGAAVMANGIATFALNRAVDRARERVVWREPIGAHQAISHPLADAFLRVHSARILTDRALRAVDEGQDAALLCNSAKYLSAEAVLLALDRAIQTFGGDGLDLDAGLADLWFIARLLTVAPVSAEMVLNYIAQHALHLPRSY